MPESQTARPQVAVWAKENWKWLLIFLCLPLFAHKTAFNAPVAVMMIAGLLTVLRSPRAVLSEPAVQFMTAVFLSFEMPILVSLPDAVQLDRALGTALVDVRFWFMGVFVIGTLCRRDARRKLYMASAIMVSIWCIDAMIQYAFGRDLLGFSTFEGRVTGMFYLNLTLGAVTATMSPLVLELIRRYGSAHKWLWLLLPALVAAVLLQGSRTGWMMLAVSLVVSSVYLVRTLAVRRSLVVAVVAAALLGIGLAAMHGNFRNRVDQTLGLFGNAQSMDEATSYRLSIWRAGLVVFEENWLNGIGPRGFRYIYDDYASKQNYFVKLGQAPTHPHSMLLEIAIETGVVGLAGYVLMWILMIKRWRQQGVIAKAEALPWLVAALVAWFPLNVHMALYASYWSTIAWWLLLVAIAMLMAERRISGSRAILSEAAP